MEYGRCNYTRIPVPQHASVKYCWLKQPRWIKFISRRDAENQLVLQCSNWDSVGGETGEKKISWAYSMKTDFHVGVPLCCTHDS